MFRRSIAISLVLVLVHFDYLQAQTAVQQSSQVTRMREKVTQLGVGKKVSVKLFNGDSFKGPIAQLADDSFVVSDQARGRDVSARYSEVDSIKGPRSTVTRIMIWTSVAAGALLGGALMAGGCSPEEGAVASFAGTSVPASYAITSPKNSNLVITLSWPDAQSALELQATITDCGIHTGCNMITRTAMDSGSSELQLRVDGSKGKQYRIDVSGVDSTAQSFELKVVYKIACES